MPFSPQHVGGVPIKLADSRREPTLLNPPIRGIFIKKKIALNFGFTTIILK